MVNKANLLIESGTIYVATNWDGTTFADGTGSNESSILASLNALTYSNIGSFTDFSISHTRNNERILQSDQCGVGEFYRSSELTPKADFTWQEINNIDILAQFMGLDVQNIAGSPISVTGENLGTGWTVGTPIRIDHKNDANTSVTSIVVKAGGSSLIVTTNYTTYVGDGTNGDLGYTYIVPVTANALILTVDYSYTPSSKKLMSYKTQSRTVPYSLIKFVTCPNDAGEVDTHFLVKVAPTGEIKQAFVNLVRTDFAGTPVALTGALGGNYLFDKETLTVLN